MTSILGGGISGLSAAYYSLKYKKLGPVILYEASDRLGGWVQSVHSKNGVIFEKGPRTIRSKGIAGKNTLDLVHDLNMKDKIFPIKSSHPAARNRLIYVNKKLHLLPNSLGSLFTIQTPFKRRLIYILWNDLTAQKVLNRDESIYSFIERRCGKDIADYLVSPMIGGICAGNAKEISVKFLMKSAFEYEQKYGSITTGFLINQLKNFSFLKNYNKLEFNARAEEKHWSVWGLKGGLEQLPIALKNSLESASHMKILTKKKCEQITFRHNEVELLIEGKIERCKRLICSLSAKNLAPLLQKQHPELSAELKSIPFTTVVVVNLYYSSNVIPMEAFGFLIPPIENIPILGVTFDSCVFKIQSGSVLTVMMGGAWFEKYFTVSTSKEHFLSVAVNEVKKILQIKLEPVEHNVSILKDCIPQYIVGHHHRLERIENYILTHNIPLSLCGSSYQGVGLNDVILSAKQAIAQIVQ